MSERYTRIVEKVTREELASECNSHSHLRALVRIANLFGVLK